MEVSPGTAYCTGRQARTEGKEEEGASGSEGSGSDLQIAYIQLLLFFRRARARLPDLPHLSGSAEQRNWAGLIPFRTADALSRSLVEGLRCPIVGAYLLPPQTS